MSSFPGWSGVDVFGFPMGGTVHGRNVGGELVTEFGSVPLVGYRSWLVVSADGGGFALKSLNQGHVWDVWNEAECRSPLWVRPEGHGVAPDPDHACGFYVQNPDHSFNEWEQMKRAKVSAAGMVEMSGRIIQCELGFKAQFVELCPGEPIVVEVSCRRGCDAEPVRVDAPDSGYRDIWSFCGEHALVQPDFENVPSFDLDVFLPEVLRSLSVRYDREFLSWRF